MSAVSTDKDRPILGRPHGNWSADGYRLHHLIGDKDKVVCECEYCAEHTTPDFTKILTPELRADFTVKIVADRNALLAACTQVEAVSKKDDLGNNTIILEGLADGLNSNGNLLKFKAQFSENGYIKGLVKASVWPGAPKEVVIALNFRFLADALEGFGPSVTIFVKNNSRPVFLFDEEREAVIMPVSLPKTDIDF